MKKDESRLVRFVRQPKAETAKENEGKILIKDLIDSEKKVFEDPVSEN